MAKTQREKLQAVILAKGGKVVKSTSKFIVMACDELAPGTHIYLGRSAVRTGRTLTESIPNDKLKARLTAR